MKRAAAVIVFPFLLIGCTLAEIIGTAAGVGLHVRDFLKFVWRGSKWICGVERHL